MLVEDDRVFLETVAWIQRRAWTHACAGNRRERGEQGSRLHRYFGRWRFAVDWTRATVSCDSSQCEHGVRAREQRRLWLDQGTVLRLGRYWLEVQARRGKRSAADRSRAV